MQKPGNGPVARLETIRILVSDASYRGWKIHKLHVKPKFLNGRLEEKVDVIKPPGFEIKG